jgi:hypothetical protein
VRGAKPLTDTDESERRDEGRKSAKTTQEPRISAGGVGGGGAPRGTLSVPVGVLSGAMERIEALIAGTNAVLQRRGQSTPADVAAKLRAFMADVTASQIPQPAYVKTAELLWACLLAVCKKQAVAELAGAAVSYAHWFVMPKLKQADPSVEQDKAYLMYWLLTVQHTHAQSKDGQPPLLPKPSVATVFAQWRAEASLGYLLAMFNERQHMLGSDVDKLIELLQGCFVQVKARVEKDSIVPIVASREATESELLAGGNSLPVDLGKAAAGAAQATRTRTIGKINSIFKPSSTSQVVWKNLWELSLRPIVIDACQPPSIGADLRGLTHCAQGILIPDGIKEVSVTWSDRRRDTYKVRDGRVSIRPRLPSLAFTERIVSTCDLQSSVKHAECSLASCALKIGSEQNYEKSCAVLSSLLDVWSSVGSGSDKPQHLDALIVVIDEALKSHVDFIGPVVDKVLAKFLPTWPSESCFELVERFMSSLSKVGLDINKLSCRACALRLSQSKSMCLACAACHLCQHRLWHTQQSPTQIVFIGPDFRSQPAHTSDHSETDERFPRQGST